MRLTIMINLPHRQNHTHTHTSYTHTCKYTHLQMRGIIIRVISFLSNKIFIGPQWVLASSPKAHFPTKLPHYCLVSQTALTHSAFHSHIQELRLGTSDQTRLTLHATWANNPHNCFDWKVAQLWLMHGNIVHYDIIFSKNEPTSNHTRYSL